MTNRELTRKIKRDGATMRLILDYLKAVKAFKEIQEENDDAPTKESLKLAEEVNRASTPVNNALKHKYKIPLEEVKQVVINVINSIKNEL